MNLTSEHLLFSGALDVRQRYIRLISLLDQASISVPAAERRVINAFKESIRNALNDYVDLVANIREAVVATSRSGEDEKWDPDARRALIKEVTGAYHAFAVLHDEVYTYVSGHLKVPNDLSHFLFRALNLSLVSESHRASVALYPSRHLMWESTSAKGDRFQPNVAAILVPFSEIYSPMRWPLLVHELAHHLSFGGDSTSDDARKRLLSSNPPLDHTSRGVTDNIEVEPLAPQDDLPPTSGRDSVPDDPRDDGLSELEADAVAEHSMGITYSLAMARESYLVLGASHHFSPGGPTVTQRLNSLHHGHDVASAVPSEWNVDGNRMDLERKVKQQIPSPEELAELISLRDKLTGGRTPAESSELVPRALKLLQVNDPIPAVPCADIPPQYVFERVAARTAKGEQTREADIMRIFTAVADVPLSDAEILETAWTAELQRNPLNMLDDVLADTDLNTVEEEAKKLNVADTRLSRSLQAAAVHRWLLENDNKIPPAPSAAAARRRGPEEAKPVASESSPLSDVQLARRLTLPVDNPKRLVVRPLVHGAQIGGTTIDLRLGTEWEALRTSRFHSLDPGEDQIEIADRMNESVEEFRLTAGDRHGLVLHPGELLLALTLEYLDLPDDLWGQLEGRSTWARVGLQVHATAGMVDAGFQGFLTLELQNNGPLPLVLYPGLRVGQMAFFPVRNIARPYKTKDGAAYGNQARVRTAFTSQHEHLARFQYLKKELEAEDARKRKLDERGVDDDED